MTVYGLKSAMNALAMAAARLKTTRQGSPAELRRKALKRSGYVQYLYINTSYSN